MSATQSNGGPSGHVILDDPLRGIRRVTLNRAAARNALSTRMMSELTTALRDADSDPSVGTLLIRAVGEAFCAGGDLKEARESSIVFAVHPFNALVDSLVESTCPIVASVQGPAVGAGLTILLHADFVLAAPDAEFAAPFTSMRVPPEAGASYLLPATVGRRVAARMLLLGERLTANQALACGLVSAVVEGTDSLDAESLSLAERLVSAGESAVRANTTILRQAAHSELVLAVARERRAIASRYRDPAAALRPVGDR